MSNLTFAIGDVHGCLEKLSALVKQCFVVARGHQFRFVFLGDYVDRGPNSKGVIDYLLRLQSDHAGSVICIQGNHEDMLLAAADDDMWADGWLRNGGTETLASYNISSANEMPHLHRAWMKQLPKFHDDGLRFYVHAGVRPGRPLNRQDDFDLLTIREPFLSSTEILDRLIVHGHTPTKSAAPDLRDNRLNLDTAAVFGGRLTAAVFGQAERNPLEFLQV